MRIYDNVVPAYAAPTNRPMALPRCSPVNRDETRRIPGMYVATWPIPIRNRRAEADQRPSAIRAKRRLLRIVVIMPNIINFSVGSLSVSGTRIKDDKA